MDQKVDAAPSRLNRRESGIDGLRLGHVAVADHNTTDLLRQRFHALFQRIALICERQIGAMGTACFGNAPAERAIIGDPHDQAAFAAHEA